MLHDQPDLTIRRPRSQPTTGEAARRNTLTCHWVVVSLAQVAPPKSTVLVGERSVRVTSPDQVLYPDAGVTKVTVIAYNVALADRLLPLLRRRPVTRVRWPGLLTESYRYRKTWSVCPAQGIVLHAAHVPLHSVETAGHLYHRAPARGLQHVIRTCESRGEDRGDYARHA